MITVIGLGFVGITTALYFSERKDINVFGYDKDDKKISKLNSLELPFYEPKLDELLKKHLNNNFVVSNNLVNCLDKSDYIFICVDTNMNDDGSVDLCSVYNVLDSILCNIHNTYKTIVIKSSIPPTTTCQKIIPYIEKHGFKVGKDIGIANNPEFLQEGYCYDEIINNNRIVIGTDDELTRKKMISLYEEKNNKNKIFPVSINTSEFCKYLSNSFLAVAISYSNEMAALAEEIGNISVEDAFNIFHQDRRWDNCKMKNYVFPGGKFGGYCLPKDIQALKIIAKKNNMNLKIVNDAIDINNEMDDYIVEKITSKIDNNKKIGILGLSFKENSDDVRNSPAYAIIKKLNKKGYNNLLGYDPIAIDNFRRDYSDINIKYIYSYDEIIKESECLVIIKMWGQFRNIKEEIDKIIIDCPRLLKEGD